MNKGGKKVKENVKWPYMPYDEFRLRHRIVQGLLVEHGIDAMILFSPTNWLYYAGFTDVALMHNSVWRGAIIISQSHEPIAILHSIYGETYVSLTSYIEDVRCWSEIPGSGMPNSFWTLFYDVINELGLHSKVLGLELGPEIHTYLSILEYQELITNLKEAKIVGCDSLIYQQRSVKTPWEIETIREGCRLGCLAVRRVFESIKPGVNERDVHKEYWQSLVELGMLESPVVSTWLMFSSNPHETGGLHRYITPPVDRILEVGDQGTFDFGPTYKGYKLDFQRSFYVGDAPQEAIDIHNMAKEALLETLGTIKAGVPVRDVFNASVQAVLKRDPNQKLILDFAGHSMGLTSHETPWIRETDEGILEEDMVLCVELTVFDERNRFVGGYPEDIVIVKKDGIENLTRYMPLDLWIAR